MLLGNQTQVREGGDDLPGARGTACGWVGGRQQEADTYTHKGTRSRITAALTQSSVTTLQAAAPLTAAGRPPAALPAPPASERLLPLRPSRRGHTLVGACRSWQAAAGAMRELLLTHHGKIHSTHTKLTPTSNHSTNMKRRNMFYVKLQS